MADSNGIGHGSWTRNAVAVAQSAVTTLSSDVFHRTIVDLCRSGARITALFGLPRTDGGVEVFAVLADDAQGRLGIARIELERGQPLASLTAELPQAQAFERELHEEHAVPITGHPWLKPLRAHPELAPPSERGPSHPFFQVQGPGVHEVAVGPVHAGIIEPGHFRFQCHGETVMSLEIHLGYQHRGVEQLLVSSRPPRRLALAESIAGDTSVGHALAHCMTLEALGGVSVPLGACVLRGIALELERLANHIGDLGALSGDVAYLPGASFFGRMRGVFLNLLMELSGNRYGRGLLCAGGVKRGLEAERRAAFVDTLTKVEAELRPVADLVFNSPSVLSRFEGTGVVSEVAARELGLVGPVARASGVARDVRLDHPAGIYRFSHIPLTQAQTGDVMARAVVRWMEAQRSLSFVKEQLRELDESALRVAVAPPERDRIAVALVEGWRGEIAHIALTDGNGNLRGYKVVDPSFHDWFGLSIALRDNQISDFPLCNKSFNLSYAGHDL